MTDTHGHPEPDGSEPLPEPPGLPARPAARPLRWHLATPRQPVNDFDPGA